MRCTNKSTGYKLIPRHKPPDETVSAYSTGANSATISNQYEIYLSALVWQAGTEEGMSKQPSPTPACCLVCRLNKDRNVQVVVAEKRYVAISFLDGEFQVGILLGWRNSSRRISPVGDAFSLGLNDRGSWLDVLDC